MRGEHMMSVLQSPIGGLRSLRYAIARKILLDPMFFYKDLCLLLVLVPVNETLCQCEPVESFHAIDIAEFLRGHSSPAGEKADAGISYLGHDISIEWAERLLA